ncbi:hypothetical protein V8C42DRAFT_360234 [Trichoderma barbatum]
MKCNITTFFAAAVALVSIASASSPQDEDCDFIVPGMPGEPDVCIVLPYTSAALPLGNALDNESPCVDIFFRDNQCRFEPFNFTISPSTYIGASSECNCKGSSFALWLECQRCLLDHGFYREVNFLWTKILEAARSAVCNGPKKPDDVLKLPSPAQTNTALPIPTTVITPSPLDSNLNPSAAIAQASWAINQTSAPVTAAAHNPCDVSRQQEDSIITGTMVTGITLTASATNQSVSITAAVLTTHTTQHVHTPLPFDSTSEISNAAVSFERPGLALVIVGLFLGVL